MRCSRLSGAWRWPAAIGSSAYWSKYEYPNVYRMGTRCRQSVFPRRTLPMISHRDATPKKPNGCMCSTSAYVMPYRASCPVSTVGKVPHPLHARVF